MLGPPLSLDCRMYDCRRFPNSQTIDQFLALWGESIHEWLSAASKSDGSDLPFVAFRFPPNLNPKT